MGSAATDFLLRVAAVVVGTLAAQYLINNVRSVRRAVGGL